jgi:hypothetical protein
MGPSTSTTLLELLFALRRSENPILLRYLISSHLSLSLSLSVSVSLSVSLSLS